MITNAVLTGPKLVSIEHEMGEMKADIKADIKDLKADMRDMKDEMRMVKKENRERDGKLQRILRTMDKDIPGCVKSVYSPVRVSRIVELSLRRLTPKVLNAKTSALGPDNIPSRRLFEQFQSRNCELIYGSMPRRVPKR